MPEWAELQIKTSQRDHLINSYKKLKKKKDSDRAITPVAEAIHVPAYFAPPGSMEPKKLRHLHAQHSLVQSCYRQKMSCIYACRVASVMSYLWDSVGCGRPGISVSGILQVRILDWPLLAAIPF